MSLERGLGLTKPIALPAHEALLNIYYTASCLKKRAGEFFRPFGLTDVQFNLMMLLKRQSASKEGLSQAQLSSCGAALCRGGQKNNGCSQRHRPEKADNNA